MALLLPDVPKSQWREPSQAVPRDQLGNPTTKTQFRVRAKTHDGVVLWCGWLDDRDDADAFLWSLVTGSLNTERPLWELPTPMWPGLDPGLVYDFATVTFLTTTGSLQTYNKPVDWNNGNNVVGVMGGGGNGGGASFSVPTGGGGGGGAYSQSSNVSLSGNASYQVGAVAGDSWFNGASFAGASVAAKGGTTGTTGVGSGGAAGSGIGSTKYSGGTGNGTAAGGAAGPNGNGNNGVSGVSGGSGDAGFGGAGGGANGNGSNGTEWSASYGSGGGGGHRTVVGGGTAGGYYGGAGGGAYSTRDPYSGGAGRQGVIYISYTPASKISFNMPMLGM